MQIFILYINCFRGSYEMKQIQISDLIPGMITEKDVYSYNDKLIISRNTTITDTIITRLEFYSIDSIVIQEEKKDTLESNLDFSTHSQKIRNSSIFHEFNETFFASTQRLKSSLDNAALKNEEISTTDLLNDVNEMVDKTLYNFNIFDMLHNMRQYDDQTYVHSLNVGLICHTFGHWLGWSEKDIETLTLCGLLHDIGKIFVPIDVIRKPALLTPSEFEIVKSHTTDGFKNLEKTSLDIHILNSILQHHERCDGTGYPNSSTGEKLDSFAKAVAIADVYDAMTCARIYRGPLCPFHVIEIFEKEGLTKYEPAYLLKFLENIALTYIHNQILLSNEQIATVVSINKTNLSRPIVKMGNNFIDLSANPDIEIKSFV